MNTLPHIQLLLLPVLLSILLSCSANEPPDSSHITPVANFHGKDPAHTKEPMAMRQFRGCKSHR